MSLLLTFYVLRMLSRTISMNVRFSTVGFSNSLLPTRTAQKLRLSLFAKNPDFLVVTNLNDLGLRIIAA